MTLLTTILASAVAIEFLYIMYLETIVPTSKQTAKVFGLSKAEQEHPMVQTQFKNQGIYNGVIALLILVAVFIYDNTTALFWLMVYIVIVAIYGGITSSPKIIIMQGGLAILTLISLMF